MKFDNFMQNMISCRLRWCGQSRNRKKEFQYRVLF